MAKRGGGRKRALVPKATVVQFRPKEPAPARSFDEQLRQAIDSGPLQITEIARLFAEWRRECGLKPEVEAERCKIQFFAFLDETSLGPRTPPIAAFPPDPEQDPDAAASWTYIEADWVEAYETQWRSVTKAIGAMFAKRVANAESRFAGRAAREKGGDGRVQWILFDRAKKKEGALAALAAA